MLSQGFFVMDLHWMHMEKTGERRCGGEAQTGENIPSQWEAEKLIDCLSLKKLLTTEHFS